MNLDFSDDQKFLQSEAKKFLQKEDSIKRSRNILDKSKSVDVELWKKIVDLGWTGIRVPEEYDGLGLGHLELCVSTFLDIGWIKIAALNWRLIKIILT